MGAWIVSGGCSGEGGGVLWAWGDCLWGGGIPKVLHHANRSCHERAIITMTTEAGKLASGRGPGVHPASQEKYISPPLLWIGV